MKTELRTIEPLDIAAAVKSAQDIITSPGAYTAGSLTFTLTGQILIAEEIRRLTAAVNELKWTVSDRLSLLK